jgi:hypothetical protein
MFGRNVLHYQAEEIIPASNRWQAVIQAISSPEMIMNFYQAT